MNFSQVKFKGKCIIDNIHLQNKKLTKPEMESIDTTEEQPWIYNSIFIANFDDNLYAGNNTGWRLKRKLESDTLFTTVKDFNFNILSYTDNEVVNRNQYIYAIHSLAAGGEGLGVQNSVNTNFYGWFLFDEEHNYKFDAGFDNGIQTGTIQVVEDVHIFNNYTEKPVFSFGQRSYKQSDITTVPYEIIDNQFTTSVGMLHRVESFIKNQKPKWLKNTAGEIFRVITTNFNYKYQDQIHQQPYAISFTWTETEDDEI